MGTATLIAVKADGELVEAVARRAAAGEARALEQLLRLIEADVLQRCSRLLPNPLDAQEACQDTLFAVSRRIATFEGRSKFSTWLYQVATNASLDTYRKLKRRGSQLGHPMEERAALERTSVVAGTKVDLFEALDRIDPRFGEPVVLRDVFELDYAEIARHLGIPEGTVKSRIHEGRKTLRWLLER